MTTLETQPRPSAAALKSSDLDLQPPADHKPRGVTWRSVVLGTICVLLICGLSPYNDFVLSDMSLTMGMVPVASMLVLFVVVVCINAPLNRWLPKYALSTAEIVVILLMTLIACALPNWGLMKFLAPMPVAPFRVGASDNVFWKAFTALNLPTWLFPVDKIADGRGDPIVTWFYNRVPPGEHIPWRAWLTPALGWGVFIAGMLASLVSMARLVTHQWVVVERLPFPILQVHTALVNAPEPGRAMNAIWRSKSLWIALAAVLFVHSLNCLHNYYRNVPTMQLSYDFTGIFANPPFVHMETKMKQATLSLVVVGVTFFIRSRVAFSLWGTYLIVGCVNWYRRAQGVEVTSAALGDQHLGASLVFVAAIFWIGREHWMRVVRNAVGLGKDDTHRGAAWIAIGGAVVMLGWLIALQVQWWMAVGIVAFILMSHLVVSRVMAETGLPIFRSGLSLGQLYTNFPVSSLTGRSVFFANVFTIIGPLNTRDSVAALSLQGFGLTEKAEIAQRQRRAIGAVVAWALLLGTITAGVSTVYCQYSYPTPPSQNVSPQRNVFGADYIPKRDLANPFDAFAAGRHPPKTHSPLLNFSMGVGLTAFLEFASLRWAWWPFLPVGFVASFGAFLANAWFSVFVGWLAKVFVVRFGGAKLLEMAKPCFIGLILGEALAAGVWLGINAIVVLNGGDPQPLKFML